MLRALTQRCGVPVRLCLTSLALHAEYSIDWSTVDDGGSTSTGGVYAVSGTIGQPDAGTTRTSIVNPPVGNRFYRLHKP